MFRLDGDEIGGHFGRSVNSGSDVSGDGLPDMMIEAPGEETPDGAGTSTFFTSIATSGDEDQDGYSNQEEISEKSDLRNRDSIPDLTSIHLNTGFNLVSIPAEMLYMDTAFKLVPILGNGKEIDRALHLNTDIGRYEEAYYAPGNTLTGTDFQNRNGDAHIIYAKEERIVPFTSKVCPTWNLVAGLNLVGTPCASADMTAFRLLKDIGSETVVSSIQWYNSSAGQFDTAAYENGQPVGMDFHIVPGEGYFIFMKSAVSGFRP